MRPPERTRVRVSPGAPALLAVFVWLSSPEVLGAVLLAALCHELGHYAVLRSRGGWVRHMEISALGANMQVAGRLSYGSELLAAAGGPAVNLLLAAALAALGRWWEPLYLLAGAQGVLIRCALQSAAHPAAGRWADAEAGPVLADGPVFGRSDGRGG